MELTRIIIKPYLTEKTYLLRENANKQVITFLVNPKANKNQILNAFVAIYGIKPEKINTVTKKSVNTRTGTLHPGRTKAKKVAYITLPVGQRIALDREEVEEAAKQQAKK